MMTSILVTVAIAALAMAPGLILLRGSPAKPGQWAAASTVSLVTMMLTTALLGEAVSLFGLSLPAGAIIPVSLAACLWSWLTIRGSRIGKLRLEWQGFALAAIFAAYGIICQVYAVRIDSSGGLMIHTWYNADWFKHLGHVAALADFGVPARDAFNGGEPLHYYWLSYILPGAGAALGGDNWRALDAANVIIAILFCLTFYGAARMVGGPNAALVSTALCFFICAPLSIAYASLTDPEGWNVLLNGPNAPNAPALAPLSQFIPQHTLAIAVLLSWLVLNRPDALAPRAVRLLALAALASIMTISILLGAMLLGVYGFVTLWSRKLKALPELSVMAMASVALVIVLGVIQLSDPNSAMASPLMANVPDPTPMLVRALNSGTLIMGHASLPFVIAAFALFAWRPDSEPDAYARRTAIMLLVVAVLSAAAAEALLPPRLAIETRIRAVNLPAIGIAIVGAWILTRYWPAGRRARATIIGVGALLVIAATPCLYVRTVWQWQLDRPAFTTTVPRDDLQAMRWLRANSPPRSIVWQYPEPPALANPPGDDAWAAVLGGRAVTASERATEYGVTAPKLETAERYFAGENVPVPSEVSWIYLSRVLHPKSYDLLVKRLSVDPAWHKAMCLQDACLFDKRPAAK